MSEQKYKSNSVLDRLKRKPVDPLKSIDLMGASSHNENIVKAAHSVFSPLSASQKRMYLLQKADEDSIAFNLPHAFEVKGPIKLDQIQNAFNIVVNRHEPLRSTIHFVDDEFVQKINSEVELEIEIYDSMDLKSFGSEFVRPFDLENGPLIRMGVCLVGGDQANIIVDMHHIVSDGVSMQIFFREFQLAYEGEKLSRLTYHYSNYTNWQANWIMSQEARKKLNLVASKFLDLPPILTLPTDYPRPDMLGQEGGQYEFYFDKSFTKEIKDLSGVLGVTNYSLLLSALMILLSKQSGQKNLVIGSPIACRTQVEVQNLIGLFVNTIAIRGEPLDDKLFSVFVNEIRSNVNDAIDCQEIPFDQLVESLNLKRYINRNPLFDVMFTMQNMKRSDLTLGGYQVSSLELNKGTSDFDLELYSSEFDGQMTFRLEYNKSLFTSDTIIDFSKRFKNILVQVVNNKDCCISDIKLLDQVEEELALLRGAKVESEGTCFPQYFEMQVERYPNNIAIEADGDFLTYRELNQKANKLAHYLIDLDIPEGSIVALWQARDINFLVSMIGLFKAGLAYVPVDPALPLQRIETILCESKAVLIITDLEHLSSVHSVDESYEISLCEEILESSCSETNVKKDILGSSLAYVIFTSGSTGKPKGAMVEHRGMINHLHAKVNDFQLDSSDVVAETATVSFDVSVWQYLTALMVGAKTVVFKNEKAWQPNLVLNEIRQKEVTIFETVPSHLILLLDQLSLDANEYDISSLKLLVLNGEQLYAELCRKWFSLCPEIRIANAYGPTECSDDVTHFFVNSEVDLSKHTVPIGYPIQGIDLYVLTSDMNVAPRNVVGELYIGGVGVGKGYINNILKTQENFIINPYRPNTNSRLYKTGDLVKVNSEGAIEYIGRVDHQVKINGVRIELGEIEHALLANENVREVVVSTISQDGKQDQQICAYVSLRNPQTKRELRASLINVLPDYLIPKNWVIMEKLPLLVNGKVDRKSLPAPVIEELSITKFVKPRTIDEINLSTLWSEVLEVKADTIGLDHEFFELGGTSLKAMKLVAKISKQEKVNLPFTTVFTHPKLSQFAVAYSEAKSKTNQENDLGVNFISEVPALPEHIRIYNQVKQHSFSTLYNMPYKGVIKGPFDLLKAKKSFEKLVSHHWIMKANFKVNDNNDLVIRFDENAKLEVKTGKVCEGDIEGLWSEFIRPYVLNLQALFRMEIYSVSDSTHYLFFDNHTISADFNSKAIILREFLSLYFDTPVEQQVKDYDYTQYVIRKHNLHRSRESRNQEAFWEGKFIDGAKRLFSQDHEKNSIIASHKGKRRWLNLSSTDLSKLVEFARSNGVSEYSACQSAFTYALSRVFSSESFSFISIIADRDQSDFTNCVGLLFDSVPVILDVKNNMSLLQFIKYCQEESTNSYLNRSFPSISKYEDLAKLDGGSAAGYFDTSIVWVESYDYDFNNTEFSIAAIKDDENVPARFDLRLEAYREPESLKLSIEYRESLFSESTILKILELTNLFLTEVYKEPSTTIGAVNSKYE